MLVACWLFVGTRATVFVSLLLLPLAFWDVAGWSLLYLVLLATIAAVFVAFFCVALPLRCDVCSAPFFIDTGAPKHRAARRRASGDYWGTLIMDALRHRHFVCMYCGTLYHLHADGASDAPCGNLFSRSA